MKEVFAFLSPKAFKVLLTVAALWAMITANSRALDTNSLNYADVLRCGPNSLFMFLILSGHSEVTLEQLRNIPVSSNGVSLASLRDMAQQLGVKAEIRQYRVEDIDSVPLPAIAPFKTSEVSFTPLHFDVIYKVDAKYIYLLNGTTGLEQSIYRPKLKNFWPGVALSQKRLPINKNAAMIILSAFLLIIDVAIVAFWMGKLPGTQKRRGVENSAVAA